MCPPRASERSSQQQRCNYSIIDTHLAFSYIIGRNCTALCTVIFFSRRKKLAISKKAGLRCRPCSKNTGGERGFRSDKNGSCEKTSNDSRDKRGRGEEQEDLSPPSGSIGFWHVKGHLMNTKKGRMPIARKRRANLAAGASADIGRGEKQDRETGKDANCTLSYPKKHRIGFF